MKTKQNEKTPLHLSIFELYFTSNGIQGLEDISDDVAYVFDILMDFTGLVVTLKRVSDKFVLSVFKKDESIAVTDVDDYVQETYPIIPVDVLTDESSRKELDDYIEGWKSPKEIANQFAKIAKKHGVYIGEWKQPSKEHLERLKRICLFCKLIAGKKTDDKDSRNFYPITDYFGVVAGLGDFLENGLYLLMIPFGISSNGINCAYSLAECINLLSWEDVQKALRKALDITKTLIPGGKTFIWENGSQKITGNEWVKHNHSHTHFMTSKEFEGIDLLRACEEHGVELTQITPEELKDYTYEDYLLIIDPDNLDNLFMASHIDEEVPPQFIRKVIVDELDKKGSVKSDSSRYLWNENPHWDRVTKEDNLLRNYFGLTKD